MLSLSPGPFPAFQCCTLKNGRAWYAKSHDVRNDDTHGKQVNQGQQNHRYIIYDKTGRFYGICAFYHMKLIFSKAFKDRLVLYISDIDLSPGDCEL